ncbi:MAG TPA: hypothetical protein VFE96_03730 [Candidatus Bathyarchaeia archaeon]|nr:hypothetical protein [Candidatus Bathyarchaeia archaeon]
MEAHKRLESSIWQNLPVFTKRFVLGALVLGFSQLILVDLYFRLQELPQIQQILAGTAPPTIIIQDGIGYAPFVISALICGSLIIASVILVNSRPHEAEASQASWLGSAWLTASAILIVDLTIDTFEIKWPIILLFAYAGLRYWRGIRRNTLSLILAPIVTIIAGLDGLNHFSGQDCVQTGLDACPGKAVSDIYLVIVLLVLMYITARSFLRSPVQQTVA